MGFTHEIPSEFENEERWLKFFTLKSLVCCLAAFGIGVLLSSITKIIFSSPVPGILLGIILAAMAYAVTMGKIPEEDYMKGGGQRIDSYLVNRICRKRSARLYVLGFGDK